MRWWNFLQRWADNSPLGVIIAGFVMVLLVVAAALVPAAPPGGSVRASQASLFADYDLALAESAIKRPAYHLQLARIDGAKPDVRVTTFRYPSLRPEKQTLKSALWVSLPEQLKAACAGIRDAQRALQQILGLPPTTGPQVVYEITARSADLFRPCMSGQDTNAATCSFDLAMLPDPKPKAPETGATAVEKDAAYAALRNAYDPLRADYDRLWFVANQMWSSYRNGFPADHVTSADYPYNGYPFTGMGWTYNWNPESAMHVGVTEFVLKKDAEVTVGPPMKPEEFCAAGTSRQ